MIAARVEAAQYDVLRDRVRGLAQLNEIFRAGEFPRAPLDGATNAEAPPNPPHALVGYTRPARIPSEPPCGCYALLP
jgi:hypothetical protein